MRTLIWILLLCVWSVMPTSAQIASLVQNPQVKKLPVRSVHCIYQDSEGYIWYGTVNGLCRDDGYNLQVFRNDFLHPYPLKSNLILSVAEDSLHHILFGTPSGAFYIDKRDYKVTPLFPETLGKESVKSLYTASDGIVYIRTNTKGFIIENQNIKEVSVPLVDSAITRAQTVNAHGLLWQMTNEKDLLCIKQSDTSPYHYSSSLPCKLVQCDDSILWATTMEDIKAYKIRPDGTHTRIDLGTELRGYTHQSKTLVDMIKAKDGNLWIAAYDQESFIIDFEKKKWVKHEVPAIVERYNCPTLIITICRKSDNTFWISQNHIGLCLYDISTGNLVSYSDFPELKSTQLNIVHELIPSSTPNQIWTVTDSSYVYGIIADNWNISLSHTIKLPEDERPKTVFEDQSGKLWIGSYRGIFTYDPKTKHLASFNDTIGHTTSFTQTADGRIWAAVTGVGVLEINGKKETLHPLKTDLLCISSTADGTIWIGTGTGELLQFSNGTFTSYSEKAGMNGDMVEKIVADQYNHLWILSNQRLTEFDPATSVYRVINTTSSPNSYSLARFMPRAISLDTLNHEIVVGGFDGFLVCSPSTNITDATGNIKVHISDLKISGKSVIFDHGKTLSDPLPANTENMEVFFTSLDHIHASTIRFAYRFDDGEWNYLPVGENKIMFRQIGKGTHRLQVKATDKNGLWSNQTSEFKLFRQPHWYETTLAYIVYALLFIMSIIVLVRYFILRTRKQEEAIWSDSAELVEMRRYLDEQPAKNDKGDDGDEREKDTKQTFTQIDKMLLDKMRIIVEQNISDADFNVASLADHMNMSRSTLMRKIKIITGKTPLQFIRDIKIESACQMLKNRTVSVAEVANRLGYTDSDYFTKTFRESVGMSPSEWQRQNQSTDE